jgi:aspartate 1-decarboxylase
MTPEEAPFHRPSLVFVDDRNRIAELKTAETPHTLPVAVCGEKSLSA